MLVVSGIGKRHQAEAHRPGPPHIATYVRTRSRIQSAQVGKRDRGLPWQFSKSVVRAMTSELCLTRKLSGRADKDAELLLYFPLTTKTIFWVRPAPKFFVTVPSLLKVRSRGRIIDGDRIIQPVRTTPANCILRPKESLGPMR